MTGPAPAAVAAPVIKNISTGATYTSLASAVSAVRSGEILELLESATYVSENVTIAVGNVTLRAASGMTPTLDGNYKDYCLRVGANGVRVSGITFVNGDTYGIKVENASDTALDNLRLNGWFKDNGLYAENAVRLQVSSVSFENCGGAGIYIKSSPNISLSGATATRIASAGCKYALQIESCTGAALSSLNVGTNWSDVILITNSSDTQLTNATVTGGEKGIRIENSPNTAMRSCTLSDTWDSMVYVKNSNGCTFDGGSVMTADIGFDLAGSQNMSILNCTLSTSTGSIGIKAVDSPGVSIRRCTVSGFLSSAIYTKNSSGLDARNTTIRETGIGVNLDDNSHNAAIVNNTIAHNQSSGVFIASGCSNVVIKNNIITSNAWDYWKWGIQCQSTDHPGLSITYNNV